MYRRQHVRILFTVSLALQVIHYGKGREKEAHKSDGENVHATAQKQQPKNQGTTLNMFNDMNRSDESSKQQSSRTFVPFTGLTDSKKLNRHCCQNGGTCILGSFCACPKHFTGRYCEHDEQNSNCGSIAHGVWVQKGCRFCRCGYGILHCLSEITQDNCDLKMEEEEELLRLRSSGPRSQQTICSLILLLCFFALLCSRLHQQL
nr:cryptic protein-like [Caretta caretta]